MISIVLADEEPIVRHGLRCLLSGEAGCKVIGESGNGLEALWLIDRLAPQVVILDLILPGMNGIELTRQITEKRPHPRVLVFTKRAAQPCVLEALKYGATGYYLKSLPLTDLVKAVCDVANDISYLSVPVCNEFVRKFARNPTLAPDPYDRLSPREREVLHLAAEGCSNCDIGEKLFISHRTAEHHRASVMKKLGMRSSTDLIRFALRRGLIPMEN